MVEVVEPRNRCRPTLPNREGWARGANLANSSALQIPLRSRHSAPEPTKATNSEKGTHPSPLRSPTFLADSPRPNSPERSPRPPCTLANPSTPSLPPGSADLHTIVPHTRRTRAAHCHTRRYSVRTRSSSSQHRTKPSVRTPDFRHTPPADSPTSDSRPLLQRVPSRRTRLGTRTLLPRKRPSRMGPRPRLRTGLRQLLRPLLRLLRSACPRRAFGRACA